MSRRPLLAGLAAGLMMTGAALAAPASAEEPTAEAASRLPFQKEVAQVFSEAAGGDRVSQPGTGIRGPSSGTASVYSEPCLGEEVRAEGDAGRAAQYRPGPEAEPRPVTPVVQERTFASPAAARAALGELRAAVRECRGETARTRTETYTWFQRSVPLYGEDRLGWSLRSTYSGGGKVFDLHYLVLRGDTVVHVVTTKRGELPDATRTQRLTRLALDTL
ncbi:hypothetical protein [uncultured Nocardioides sp.]|uniref:hypothetical protein n=1 Tax=uncultured Nocardioides sp. TaxID=198441 RepID=UPI002637EAFE|nr:hypothetical protein [uncultured Nocardioides sp.]